MQAHNLHEGGHRVADARVVARLNEYYYGIVIIVMVLVARRLKGRNEYYDGIWINIIFKKIVVFSVAVAMCVTDDAAIAKWEILFL